ncbi:MAG TPA: putative inorganic carbon transporter subunit DabA, partial [Pirellulales bacterium]
MSPLRPYAVQPTSIEQSRPPSDQPPESIRLERAIEKIGNLLPVSGPITAFAWLNTLQGFEDLPFEEAVKRAGRLFGCHPYLTEDRYRDKFVQGRIRRGDLAAVLAKDLEDGATTSINSLCTRLDLRLAMLEFPLRSGPSAELRWFVAETDALTRLRSDAPSGMRERFIAETRHWVMRDLRVGGELKGRDHAYPRDPRIQLLLADLVRHFGEASMEQWSDTVWETFALQALWRICREGAHATESVVPAAPQAVRHRDVMLEATAEDCDQLVHEVLIRFCAAFTDQGFAHWALPDREAGFYRSFTEVYRQAAGPPQRWLAGLPAELERLDRAGIGPLESILESLEILGIGEDEWDDYLAATMLALRGWASMILQNEVRADRVPVPVPPGSLVEFLAIRLVLDRLALAHVARKTLGHTGPLAELRSIARARLSKPSATSVEQRAFLVFQLAQVLGWYPPALYHMSKRQWSTLLAEIETFGGLERRRMFHLAFERRFRTQTLDALSVYTRRPPERVASPRFQAVFCIDTREESFRRHLEELIPESETFSTAGFFGVAIYYRGVADAHYAALCPIVIKPKHWITEEVVYPLEESNRARAKTRRALGTASHQFHVRSRAIAAGAFLSAGLGVLASVPLVARVMFPRATARIRRTAGQFVQPPPITRLRLERVAAEPSMAEEGIGFSLEEMCNLGEKMLREIGLISGFSRLVLLLGHGSYCLNNPHKSAYD